MLVGCILESLIHCSFKSFIKAAMSNALLRLPFFLLIILPLQLVINLVFPLQVHQAKISNAY